MNWFDYWFRAVNTINSLEISGVVYIDYFIQTQFLVNFSSAFNSKECMVANEMYLNA